MMPYLRPQYILKMYIFPDTIDDCIYGKLFSKFDANVEDYGILPITFNPSIFAICPTRCPIWPAADDITIFSPAFA